MYSSRLLINSALLPENTKTPLNEFRDDYYRGTTLVIALPICMGQLLAIALSRLLTGAPAGLSPHSEISFPPVCLPDSRSHYDCIRNGIRSLREPCSGVLHFINVLSDLHFNISSIASAPKSVNLGGQTADGNFPNYIV